MFDKSTLSQLKNLKQEIENSKEYGQGIVKGTERRFGFVVLDDEREIFLAPEEMDKVFPGDQVRIQIHTNKGGKISGELMKVINSPLKEFTGRYVVKGKGHFVEPDLPRFKRWIFVPPAARKQANNGDFVHCKISRHAYPAAKPQAKVLEVIGNSEQAGIEADYNIRKFKLDNEWPKEWQASLKEVDTSQREDLSATDFVTIDAPNTQDMDDALHIEASNDGWQLSVAIADPSAYITEGSALDNEALRRGTSVYMPGKNLPMLPEQLSIEHCSLRPEQTLPALVCRMTINKTGDISNYQILEAMICSKAKLSYQEVSALLDADSSTTSSEQNHGSMLTTLNEAAQALLSQRKRDHLIVTGRPEFHIRLNEQAKIESIEPSIKSSAHLLVEECMVAANRCAADFLGEQGLFHGHAGFRPERLEGVNKLADEQLGLKDIDFSDLDAYRQLISGIKDEELDFPVRSVLSRMLERGRLNTQPKPHFGMGLKAYTTFTSPIRKYSDLHVHRLIKAKLHKTEATLLNEQQLEQLQDSLGKARQARQQMEQWLKCQYLQAHQGERAEGIVSQINSNGFTVRLNGTGIEGFVDTRLIKEKYSFDPLRLRLTSKSLIVELDQAINITIDELDINQRRIGFGLCKEEQANPDKPASAENS